LLQARPLLGGLDGSSRQVALRDGVALKDFEERTSFALGGLFSIRVLVFGFRVDVLQVVLDVEVLLVQGMMPQRAARDVSVEKGRLGEHVVIFSVESLATREVVLVGSVSGIFLRPLCFLPNFLEELFDLDLGNTLEQPAVQRRFHGDHE